MPKNLMLLRHGITFDKLTLKKQKSTSSLAAIGINQIDLIASFIISQNINVDFIITSPTTRAKESAIIILNKLSNNPGYKEDIKLKEIYFDDFCSDFVNINLKKTFDDIKNDLSSLNNVLIVSHLSFIKLFSFYLIFNNLDPKSENLFRNFSKSIRVGNGCLICLKLLKNKNYLINKIINVD